jgi:DNA modification methylase
MNDFNLAYILGEDDTPAMPCDREVAGASVLIGDAIESMRKVPDGSVQCCVTSPPYFGLRSYTDDPAEIGKEQTPAEYVSRMCDVFREVHRVLRDDGVCFVNLGDSYAANRTYQVTPSKWKALDFKSSNAGRVPPGLKAKDLIGIPWMIAFALRDRLGFYLRQDIIWHKPNPMPESVRDRCTKAHEYVFLLSKSARYFWDADAVKEPVAKSSVSRLAQNVAAQAGSSRVPGKVNGPMRAVGNAVNRNRRSVWSVSTKPYRGAHFAVMPDALVEPCVLAGSRPGDIVLDPFGGSGTTAGVALKHGRQALVCELNPAYVDLMANRISDIKNT